MPPTEQEADRIVTAAAKLAERLPSRVRDQAADAALYELRVALRKAGYPV